MSNTVREVTYRLLRDLGMTKLFGNPGSNELPFLKELPEDFNYVLALHERGAAGMALGYALARGDAAFVNLHSIASVGNGLSAIVDAYCCHVPLVITSGQQDRRHILAEPFLISRAVEVVRSYVKWACEPLRAQDVPSAIARGYYIATQPPRGPVFISIPMDDWNQPCEALAVRKVCQTIFPDSDALQEVIDALGSASNPAIIVGSQIEEDGAWHEVILLAEHLAADVYDEPIPSRWTFPRRHYLFRGGLPPAQKPLGERLADHDVVLVLGAPVFLYYAYVPGPTIVPGSKLFQITNSPVDASSALAGTSIVGNLAVATRHIRHRAKPAKRAMSAPQEPRLDPEADHPITASYVFSTLNKVLPNNAILVEECPSSKGDLDRCILLDEPGSFYSVRSGILGFGLPLAVGLQIGHPDRRVVCAVGDGSAQYSIQALWSAVEYKAPVIFLCLRNGDYSALKAFCDFTKVGRNVPGVEIPHIDMVKLAQGYGMAAQEVDRPEDLPSVLEEAFALKHPYLISVNVKKGGQTCMGMDLSVNPPNYG